MLTKKQIATNLLLFDIKQIRIELYYNPTAEELDKWLKKKSAIWENSLKVQMKQYCILNS